jgi:predicted GNAT superfamily acetyltransferase
VYVTPTRRGGIAARMLIDAFERWARDKGAARVLLGITTGVRTDATETFYNKLGYNTVGVLTIKEMR